MLNRINANHRCARSQQYIEWKSAQLVDPDRLQRLDGGISRFELRRGDRVAGTNGTRAEVVGPYIEPGTKASYEWGTRFGRGFPNDPRWQVFTQWHPESGGGSPPVELNVKSGQMYLTINRPGQPGYERIHLGPATEDTWHRFKMDVTWSPDPNVGHIKLMVNGEVKVDRYLPTMYPGERNYMKMGLYRHPDIPGTAFVYHTDVRTGVPLKDLLAERPPRPLRA